MVDRLLGLGVGVTLLVVWGPAAVCQAAARLEQGRPNPRVDSVGLTSTLRRATWWAGLAGRVERMEDVQRQAPAPVPGD